MNPNNIVIPIEAINKSIKKISIHSKDKNDLIIQPPLHISLNQLSP
tara:strand:- start:6 stop:143 length:138 start_codon:yes stop_codon:yes gene_type:complete